MAAQHGLASALPTQNLVAIVRGRDPKLRGQYVVLGAHFDHLGRSATFGALDPEAKDAIRNGADDNASGTAGIMELARLLAANPPRRSVVIVAFSAEELGILGSSYFVANPPAPIAIDSIQAMLNFDMIGRLRNDRLLIFGTGTSPDWPSLISAMNGTTQFTLGMVPDGFGPSDHSAFYARNVPVLHFFSDTHEDYHRASDDADRINVAGIARIVRLAEMVAREVADRDARLVFTQTVATSTPRASPSRSGAQPYLGSVPDMAAADRPGLRLTGVTAGSPADRAGLKAGDIVVSLGGTPVVDLTSYSNALYAHKPGDQVEIVVMRGNERLALQVTLGSRGQ
jgi:Zn-dependent M28 family amino/carboxypeptidase